MNSRERVRTALDHKEPDRVPVSFGVNPTSITECPPNAKGYSNLCEYLGIDDFATPVISDAFNIVGNIDPRVMAALGSDFRDVGMGLRPARAISDREKVWEGFFGLKIRKTLLYDELVEPPGRNWTSREEIDRYEFWPDPENPVITEGKRVEAESLHLDTSYAVLAGGWFFFVPFNAYAFLCGYEKWFLDMKDDEKLYFYLCDKMLDIGLQACRRFLVEVGPYVDLVLIGDDLGTQEGLLISPADYRRYIKPYTRKIIETIKQYSQAKIAIHSCGSVYGLIPDFLDVGIEVLNPVQVRASNMDPSKLKREFGKDIVFWGGIDEQYLLPKGTPEQIREEVKKTIDIMAPGGGFILGPTHNIQPDTPPENIVAMYDAAKEFGEY